LHREFIFVFSSEESRERRLRQSFFPPELLRLFFFFFDSSSTTNSFFVFFFSLETFHSSLKQQQRQQRQRTTTTIIGRDGSFAGALIFASRVFVSARFTCTVLRFFSAYFSSTDCRISSHFGAKNESNQQQH
jgi:hypothetical protein